MPTERSLSRGRGLQSSGRGGAGNIRTPSMDVDRVGVASPDDFSDTRGRDPIARHLDSDAIISTGRGGAGNIRSPSRDAIRADVVSIDSSPSRSSERGRGGYDRDLISAIDTAHDNGVHSSGRGGLGNITRPDSKSRSRSRDPVVNSAGRGGAGNLYIGSPVERGILEVEENERVAHKHAAGMHSIGRGGVANLTPGEMPNIEAPVNPLSANHPHATHTHDLLSTGRGGAGNIERSRSREPSDKDRGHGLTGLLHRVTHTGAQKGEVQNEVVTTA